MTAGYPFTAIVGLDELKLALLLNAVSPSIGGVLVRGEKGTAKSTVVRALAALLPDVAVVTGCRFSCDPAAPDPSCSDGPHPSDAPVTSRAARLVELPVGASEDRVVGSLDLERALTSGVTAFEPGLLAAAHRGVLYVDEVNLLHDHLVDLLLDAAALGTCYVERDNVSVRHASRFLLVGTMNPEEGELRPQLLDRFGLAVDVRASRDPEQRAEVVRRRLAQDADPVGFAAAHDDAQRLLAARIVAAREALPQVVLGDPALRQLTAVCAAFDVDGLRADLVSARAAVAHAAWEGRDAVGAHDVRAAVRLALPHRRRRDPFDAPGLDEARVDEALAAAAASTAAEPPDDAPPDGPPDDSPDHPPPGGQGAAPDGAADGPADGPAPADGAAPAPAAAPPAPGPPAPAPVPSPAMPGAPYRARLLALPTAGDGGPAGRRGRTRGAAGRTVGAVRPATAVRRLHVSATLTAAAPHQLARGRLGPGLLLRPRDLREAVREGREANLVLFCVDASGSMAARQRMGSVKTAVLSLLLDAYQRRDKVGVVAFRDSGAHLVLPPTSSVELAVRRLAELPTGGRTPLAAGLTRAGEVLRVERLRDPARRALLLVVTDGRHTSGPDPVGAARLLAVAGVGCVVVDCEAGAVRLGLAGRLAGALDGVLLPLDAVAADGLAGVVRDVRGVA
ncbi:MAG TPA: VWA domain-containing protein [Mycobacteriales bacterium]|nr:VWA domain-containing protein [Mycobacteriales bacterium]